LHSFAFICMHTLHSHSAKQHNSSEVQLAQLSAPLEEQVEKHRLPPKQKATIP